MHRALSLQDIVREICACNAGDLRSLAALARTCTQIYELVIHELWKEIWDFVPLAKCLPEDSWTVLAGELTITRSLVPEDWKRLLYYAKHVRRIKLWGHGLWRPSCRLHSSALSAILISRPTAVLFPRVQRFDWNCADLGAEDLGAILGLLGSHIKYLHVCAPDLLMPKCVQRLGDALFLVARQFPRLESFSFGEPVLDFVIRGPPPFPEALLLPQTLRSLTTYCFHVPTTEDVIYALARLHSLQTLRIALPFDSTWPAECPPQAFSSLRHLFLRVTGPDYIAFSAVWRFPVVADAHLNIIDVPDQVTVSQIFRSVRTQFSVTSLRELQITCADDSDGVEEEEEVDSVVRPAHLGHLLVFTGLRRLKLSMACRYALDDDFYHNVATAFPHLTTLTIADDDRCPHDSLPLMTALVPFALHPSLSSLSVPFNGTQEVSRDDIRNALPPGSRPSPVQSLGVGSSPLTDPQLVATYLARLFPGTGCQRSLDFAVSDETDEGDERYERWTKVGQLLTYFRMIREDERNIAAQQLGRT